METSRLAAVAGLWRLEIVNPRPSTCSTVPGAFDVDVSVALDSRVMSATVTRIPGGAPGVEQWLDGGLFLSLVQHLGRDAGDTVERIKRRVREAIAAAQERR